MALRSEAVAANLVSTSGLFRRPDFKMWAWIWESFGTASHAWRSAKQLCSASLLLPGQWVCQNWARLLPGMGWVPGKWTGWRQKTGCQSIFSLGAGQVHLRWKCSNQSNAFRHSH